MVKTKSLVKSRSSRAIAVNSEPDAIYILKLVLYLILGSQWLRITKGSLTVPLPIGLLLGLFFARSDRRAFDRKIAYAILLLSMFIGFWLPIGLELVL
jgi:hypothetical protein